MMLLLVVGLVVGCTYNQPSASSGASAFDSAAPTRVGPQSPADLTGTLVDVARSGFNACALRDDGTLACWGEDIPPLFDNYRFIDLEGSPDQLCGITAKLDIVCFSGRSPTFSTAVGTVGRSGDLQRFSAGRRLGDWCALVDGKAVCDFVEFEGDGWVGVVRGDLTACAWRSGEPPVCQEMDYYTKYASLEDSGEEPKTLPGNTVIRDCALYPRTCVVVESGAVECLPDQVPAFLGPASISEFERVWTDYDHACALTSRGRAWCWGADGLVPGPPGDEFTVLSVVASTACGVRRGRVECWEL